MISHDTCSEFCTEKRKKQGRRDVHSDSISAVLLLQYDSLLYLSTGTRIMISDGSSNVHCICHSHELALLFHATVT